MLVKTPATGPEDNQVRLRIDFEFSGQALIGHLSLEASGAISDRLKSMLSLNPKRDEALRSMVKSVSPKARILEMAFPRLGDPRAPFLATARFELSEAWSPGQDFGQSIGAVSMLSTFTKLLTLPAPRARSTDYFLGVRMQLSQEIRHAAPSQAYEANIFSPSRSIQTPHFSFIKSADRDGSDITTRQRITLHRTTVRRAEYKAFYENVQRMLEQSDVKIAFKKRKAPSASIESAASVGAGDGKGPAALLRRARVYLRTARYAEARTLVEGVLAADSKNGEAHYLLGVALGHLDEYEASAAAFKKARGLGYRP